MNEGEGIPLATAVATAEAVPVAQPVGYGQQMGGYAADNTFLLNHAGLYVRQHLEVLELISGCETKNRYSFTPIPVGTSIPKLPSSGWSKEYRTAAGFNPLLKGKEESECFERVCCPLFRGFQMALKDGAGTDFITLDRPFKCDPCYCAPLMMCQQQEMSISTAGRQVANAKEVTGMCCSTGCCARKFETYDGSGKLMYTLEVNDCSSKSGGCNCCAPSLCNEALTVDVYSSDGSLQTPSTFVWPGCNCGGLTDLSNMIITFPEATSADDRTALLAGMMLIEFTVMEQRRQNQKNNNGGGGGGVPANQEMKR
eukprot:CAMPEP_0119343198 /NCGR_PEP_ID=MMETSP1333-20130426/106320_1 /TAXON_ID=418940 /ORGANISM="Scyphosphaera apsteinii, Strain RCC1455" /LENGTH=311 /DNA_ID=CAMNT_0007355577 /DNA_START=90 /DNA_END=1025 /DNA_ORIENTATION=+